MERFAHQMPACVEEDEIDGVPVVEILRPRRDRIHLEVDVGRFEKNPQPQKFVAFSLFLLSVQPVP